MTIDISGFLQTTTRGIQSEEYEGREVRVLTATRSYATSVNDLWDAFTNPERLSRWFLPVSGELTLGGRYALEGNAEGRILECEPPIHFQVTWECGGDVSWVDITLCPGKIGTELTLKHIACLSEEMWHQYGPGAVGVGWEGGLYGLANYLTGDADLSPDAKAKWMASDDYRQFVRSCSNLWAEASITFGTPEASARNAEAATTAFYTGEPLPE